MTGRDKTILAVFGLAFVLMMYGVIPWEDMGIGIPTLWWWFPEMTALFILFSVIIGLIGRMSEGELTDSFVDGARDLLGVALIIGIARGITVVMNNGGITDTVLHWAEQAVEGLGPVAFAIVVFLLFLPLSFLIPSSSGLATVAMPIMAPLAAFVGVQADLIVTAFQSASGLMNLFIPTSAVVMGGLAIARVPYGTYLRWVWPLLAMLAALVIVVLGVGAAAGLTACHRHRSRDRQGCDEPRRRFHQRSRHDTEQQDRDQGHGGRRLVHQGGDGERDQDHDGRGFGQDQQPGPGAGLVPDAKVTKGHEGEHDQGDGAADRGDRIQVEEEREDDRRSRGDEDAHGGAPAHPATHRGWELADGCHLLPRPVAG